MYGGPDGRRVQPCRPSLVHVIRRVRRQPKCRVSERGNVHVVRALLGDGSGHSNAANAVVAKAELTNLEARHVAVSHKLQELAMQIIARIRWWIERIAARSFERVYK